MKISVRQLAKTNEFLSLTDNFSFAVWGFLSFFILVRSVEQVYFGEWVLYITAGTFIEMLRFGLTRTAIVRFLSGAEGTEKESLIGANWLIGLIATSLIALILFSTNLLFKTSLTSSGYALFFAWYPLLAFINLPFNNAISILQANQRFDKILFIRTLSSGLFVVFLILNYFLWNLSIRNIVIVHLLINAIASLMAVTLGWDGIRYIFKASISAAKTLLNFGKYTIGTLIGSYLLKSADLIIIGLSPILGTVGVAIYSVPLKLTEIFEIPLRSFIATAYPKMSKASIENNPEEVKNIFYTYSGALTILMVVICAFSILFARSLVLLIGGEEYIAAYIVFIAFAVYGFLLPIDRFTGVTLDSINKPRKNFYKVIIMTLTNVIGDVIVVFVIAYLFPHWQIQYILLCVALVTILMTLTGLIIGFKFLNRELQLHFMNIFIYGYRFYATAIKKMLKKTV